MEDPSDRHYEKQNNSLMFYCKLRLLSFIFISVRGTLPQFCYDKLIFSLENINLIINLFKDKTIATWKKNVRG